MSMKKIALIPGTFDPVTVGHLEIVKYAADIFDEVVVCICFNSEKTHLFAESERRNMLEKAVAPYANVRVDVQHGMTADYAVSIGAEYIIRGIETEDGELDAFLFSLGCYSGEPITVVSRNWKNSTVSIKDGRYNIDNQLAEAILI